MKKILFSIIVYGLVTILFGTMGYYFYVTKDIPASNISFLVASLGLTFFAHALVFLRKNYC